MREKIYNKINKNKKRIASFVHENCIIDKNITIPKGVICYPNSTIHSNVQLGFGTVVNSNVTIGHETIPPGKKIFSRNSRICPIIILYYRSQTIVRRVGYLRRYCYCIG